MPGSACQFCSHRLYNFHWAGKVLYDFVGGYRIGMLVEMYPYSMKFIKLSQPSESCISNKNKIDKLSLAYRHVAVYVFHVTALVPPPCVARV